MIPVCGIGLLKYAEIKGRCKLQYFKINNYCVL